MMSDTKQQPKRKRRWLRYSIRTLLIVVTIFCVALGYWVNRANRQRDVVKWVEENGGSVTYDFGRIKGRIKGESKGSGLFNLWDLCAKSSFLFLV